MSYLLDGKKGLRTLVTMDQYKCLKALGRRRDFSLIWYNGLFPNRQVLQDGNRWSDGKVLRAQPLFNGRSCNGAVMQPKSEKHVTYKGGQVAEYHVNEAKKSQSIFGLELPWRGIQSANSVSISDGGDKNLLSYFLYTGTRRLSDY